MYHARGPRRGFGGTLLLGAFALVVSAGAAQVVPVNAQSTTPPERLRIATDHLDIQPAVIRGAAPRPHQAAVLLIIRVRRGMHIYAKGAEKHGFVPITVHPTSPSLPHPPPRYSSPDDALAAGDGRRVPAYSRGFTIVQDVPFGPDGRAVERWAGIVRYQACDETICYQPVSVNISLTLPPSAAPPASRP